MIINNYNPAPVMYSYAAQQMFMSTAGGAWVRAVLFHQLSDSYLPSEGWGWGRGRVNKVKQGHLPVSISRECGGVDGGGGEGGDSTRRERGGGGEDGGV